jgi:hypothetical protein
VDATTTKAEEGEEGRDIGGVGIGPDATKAG